MKPALHKSQIEVQAMTPLYNQRALTGALRFDSGQNMEGPARLL